MHMDSRETKIFDPADGFGSVADLRELADSTLAFRDGRWWLYAAGQVSGSRSTQLFSASLPLGAPLSADGWQITVCGNDPIRAAVVCEHDRSAAWDLKGGRHCPCWVRGYDPHKGRWVERIYYAGGAEQMWGPYTIGFLEWDGDRWVDQPAPAFVAEEPWEHGSVFEPNVIYADGQWRMWYVAGSNHENYLIHGYAESEDGAADWTGRRIFAPPEMKLFDFAVTHGPGGYEAVFARVWLAPDEKPSATGLWWCRADFPSPDLSGWSQPVQIMTAADQGWHSGPWKPCLRLDEQNPDQRFVFFNGVYRTEAPGPFPFNFTVGCLDIREVPGTPD
ncbi:MAG: hypothetical protein WA414_10480 [Acidobacteriaceae bacterium]